ncbi:PD-(D/E)XK nuclease family protein [Ichthyenterobacterium magnum]|uniref:PD-(D/E)XK nuclease superfamily protein n=1 Tax=Ichthyenterobacterium magnum TaxID=1230530 RepID=A0A420DWW2_9FLAO|nr:PD-(D/E)XK nuclease family protein [Ichthyenterobacterium magnum]RKE98732.1 PD-(D/E)XK nuclease superfamily protein [Ichthyenterobacterium magnum]
MTSFIENVIIDLQEKNTNFSQTTFILPSRRAGSFLKNILSKHTSKTIFSPEILSIEEFVESLSNIVSSTNTELLFEFYAIYLKTIPKQQIEPFDSFSKWSQILIQDFNEIDRFLIEPNQIFDYLSAIKEIENQHWSLEEEQTQSIKNYLLFWNRIKTLYKLFNESLLSKQKGYQGLIYREAVENLEQYIATHKNKNYIFIGFNALNKAEQHIIQELLQQGLAKIYWDIDSTFFNNPIHDAGLFTRQHKKNWPYFRKENFNWISNLYASEKNINLIGAPKNISQIKYVSELLNGIQVDKNLIENTAIVLGDETLLLPLLNSIPEGINNLNITMGLPLRSIPLSTLFEVLFSIHKSSSKALYYKDVITVISHQFIKPILDDKGSTYSDKIATYIQENNIIYVTLEQLKKLAGPKEELIKILFSSWLDNPEIAINNCSKLIMYIKGYFDEEKDKNLLPLEYLYRFNNIFNELNSLNSTYSHIYNIKTLHNLYKEIIKNESLDFKGEPLKGLQIMGMLESRVLDFETVIITSVNEGILPAGKSNNSFIPFDVKLENGLPTYKEKDAVYTYHFYRLLQRAKNIYILYNTEPDVLNGGEKSRFITQLEIESKHNINNYIVAPKVTKIEQQLNSIVKNADAVKRIQEIANKGFSPSSLTNYVRNPIDFYYQKILGIQEFNDVEENVALNTLGTIIHNTLEDFYKPLTGSFLSINLIKKMKSNIEDTVMFHFKNEYKEGDITKGKNLIIFEIAKHYISNFLNLEIESLTKENEIKIIAIETENNVQINIEELNFKVNLTGKVDRVDEFNGVTRIIDYKTGRVDQGKVEVVDWKNITQDYDKYSKSFQVLMYAYMMFRSKMVTLPLEAGIISFKNLNSGFLRFAKKESQYTRTKEQLITEDTLGAFEKELKKLIIEICNPEINFIEKEL